MTDEHDSRDDEEHRPDGLLGAIRLVVDSLVDAERDGRKTFGDTGRTSRGHFTTEYGFSGRIGGPRRRSDDADSRTPRRSRDDRHLVDVRRTDDELLVVADMPDVDADDITTGIDEDRGELVVGVGNDPVERMDLPWPVEAVDAQFRHGVLELRFERADDDDERAGGEQSDGDTGDER